MNVQKNIHESTDYALFIALLSQSSGLECFHVVVLSHVDLVHNVLPEPRKGS